MEKRGITRELYLGFAELSWIRSDCSTVDWGGTVELRLDQAEAPVDAIILRPGGGREE
jgi:hypothetical protein